jgi:hypothetical protein
MVGLKVVLLAPLLATQLVVWMAEKMAVQWAALLVLNKVDEMVDLSDVQMADEMVGM